MSNVAQPPVQELDCTPPDTFFKNPPGEFARNGLDVSRNERTILSLALTPEAKDVFALASPERLGELNKDLWLGKFTVPQWVIAMNIICHERHVPTGMYEALTAALRFGGHS